MEMLYFGIGLVSDIGTRKTIGLLKILEFPSRLNDSMILCFYAHCAHAHFLLAQEMSSICK